jgi:hypothetical protein
VRTTRSSRLWTWYAPAPTPDQRPEPVVTVIAVNTGGHALGAFVVTRAVEERLDAGQLAASLDTTPRTSTTTAARTNLMII